MPVVTISSPLFKVQVVNNATTVVVRETNTQIISVGTIIQTGGTSYITFTAGATVTVGDLLSFNDDGRVVPADSAYPSSYGSFNPYEVIGVARTAGNSGDSITAYVSYGESYSVSFDSNPVLGDIGKKAYLTSTVGKCSLIAPTASAVVVEVGIINLADGSSSAGIIFSPQTLVILP
jgi:hypothetical protein